LDHYNSSSSSLKTTNNNSSTRFSFRNENYTADHQVTGRLWWVPLPLMNILSISYFQFQRLVLHLWGHFYSST